MSNKRNRDLLKGDKRRHTITMETKVGIIKKYEKGEKMADIARAHKMSHSTIRTIIRDKVRIMDHVKKSVSMHTTIITKKRGILIEKMEKLLVMWIEDMQQQQIPISLMLIQEKALSLYEDLKCKNGDSVDAHTFTASHGWFQKFRDRNKLHNIKVAGEAASADKEGATNFIKNLAEIIKSEDYLPQQIFNVDETGLYWKKMPDRSYISELEKSIPGFKMSKDRLTLLLGGNASGDCKIKPLLIYHSENPRALKNISKSSLPVIWKSNRKAWMTREIFEAWVRHHFIQKVDEYCKENNLPFKILLLVDNAPGHSLCDYNENVKIMFLSPNTTSIIQPMDQGVIHAFKKYYLRITFRQVLRAIDGENGKSLIQFWKEYSIYKAVKNIGDAWNEISISTMSNAWNKLIPQLTTENNMQTEEVDNVISELVEISKKMNLNLEEDDFINLINSHSTEMSNEDLMELEDLRKEDSFSEEQEEHEQSKQFETKKMAECLNMIENGLSGFEAQDPDAERFAKVSKAVNDAIECYSIIYEEKRRATRQTTLHQYFDK